MIIKILLLIIFSLAWIGYLIVSYKKKSYGYYFISATAFSVAYKQLEMVVSSEYIPYAKILRIIIVVCMTSAFVYYLYKEKIARKQYSNSEFD